MTSPPIGAYFDQLRHLAASFEATDDAASPIGQQAACSWVIDAARDATGAGGKLIFIGNGGSAGIASHLAIDYSKNGGLRAIACNDAAALTCIANDYGYEQVFAKQLEFFAQPGDLLIAISSSGRSANILNAAARARIIGCGIVTLSGFTAENPLRRLGDMNFYIPSDQYGFVEISHLSLCHAILDFACGWHGAPHNETVT